MLLRLLLLSPMILALLHGLTIGLMRMNVLWIDVLAFSLPFHGAVMVNAFLGTLIGLERAVAIKRWWTWLAPVVSAIAYIILLANGNLMLAGVGWVISGIALMVVNFHAWKQLPSQATLLMKLGAVAWVIGNATLVINNSVTEAVPWWIAFLLLTVIGERLDLNKVRPFRAYVPKLLSFLIWVYIGTLLLTFLASVSGIIAQGLIIVLIALWLLRYDMARLLIRQKGLSQFIGFTLLIGYVWLVLFGILLTLKPFVYVPPDTLWHTFFLGFVFSMIFAHGPVVFPAIIGRNFSFSRLLYFPVVIFQFGLLLRFVGALFSITTLWHVGAVLSAVAIVGFLLTVMKLTKHKK